MSVTLRDALVHQCWKPAHLTKPKRTGSPHFPVTLFGVVDDKHIRLNGEPFVEVVNYWPALDKYTITAQTRAGFDVCSDVEVRVTFWQPMFKVPTIWP